MPETRTLHLPPALPRELRRKAPSLSEEDKPREYHVKEMFFTVQGEGAHAGTPAVFVRLTGCNMWSGYDQDRKRDSNRTGALCPLWCDTDFTREGAEPLTAEAIGARAQELGGKCRFLVLTGGEPLLQADRELVGILKQAFGFYVAVETNGTVALAKHFTNPKGFALDLDRLPDWICVSPKLKTGKLRIEHCHELKLVVPDYHPDLWKQAADLVLPVAHGGERVRLLWLQPEDGPRFKQAVDFALTYIRSNPDWRISAQSHKALALR